MLLAAAPARRSQAREPGVQSGYVFSFANLSREPNTATSQHSMVAMGQRSKKARKARESNNGPGGVDHGSRVAGSWEGVLRYVGERVAWTWSVLGHT